MRFLSALLLVGVLVGQEPPAPKPAKPKKPIPEPKNLQVLKGSGPEIIAIMQTYNAALTVKCSHCHVQGNFASDDNPKKAIARTMITMTNEINGKLADLKATVSCYTCHRGEIQPKTAPADSATPSQGTPPPPTTPPPAP